VVAALALLGALALGGLYVGALWVRDKGGPVAPSR